MEAPELGLPLDAARGELGHPLLDPDPVHGAEIIRD
jgi:hypothetical protein